ncbi:MAG: hypothetical protein V7780_06265 [Colwellia sp.]|uniref:PDZ domain-containing protein n=1 Tax=Colwellia sp. Bg11-12 TaxID=2759817 RepID=UPI0015F5BB86|nr:PDZ domain-containing protein [Colwellia sp. Bg11-12]MBA6264524.1 hypothetical protein [Colwellia sp. Bg11-12]
MRNKGLLKLVTAMATLPIILLAQTVNASECASVSFDTGKINGNKVILELLGSNGVAIPQPKKYQKILKGEHEYLLAPGMHTLILNQWDKSEFSTYQKNLRRGRSVTNPPTPIQKTVNIEVKKNQHYQLVPMETIAGSIVEVKNQESKSCSGKYIADAKIDVPKLSADELPAAIEKLLGLVMKSISSHHKKTADKRDDTNIVSRKLNGYFGTALAQEFVEGKLQVNRIIPNTLAAELGLVKGDLITKIGGSEPSTSNNTPSQAINAYLISREFGEKIVIEVIRNGKSVTLSGDYIPVVVPEAYYTVEKKTKSGITNQSNLSASLTFQFDQLLLAINSHYKKMGEDNKIIVIERPSFHLEVNLASVGQAQKTMLSESLKKDDDYDETRNKRKRSSGYINPNMKSPRG